MKIIFMCLLTIISVGFNVEAQQQEPKNNLTTQKTKTVRSAYVRAATATVLPISGGLLLFLNDHALTDMAGSILFIYGTLLGPSEGNLYAKDGKRAIRGITGRALGIGMVIFGAVVDYNNQEAPIDNDDKLAHFLYYSGAAVYAISSIYNLATTSKSVREYNKNYIAQRTIKPQLAIGKGIFSAGLEIHF